MVRKIDLNNFQVARSETARDINRRILLNLIRKHQPVSRADLSRHSGLQRSTVSSIAEQLLAERWVTEGAMGHLPRGRKPTFLHLNRDRVGIIAIDLRPLKTTIALAGLDNRFFAQESIPTGKDPVKFLKQLGGRLCDLMKAHPHVCYEGIGVALPGRVDLSTKRLFFAPNLGWRDLDVKTPLEQATGLAVELENDANTCALAELWSGQHADGVPNMLSVAVTEGIGVGMILNGQLVRGSTGVAGEFGHIALHEDGPLCNCGNHGCWEVMASNSAASRYYGRTGSARNHAVNGSGILPEFQDILQLAKQGDVRAGEALDQMAHHLGAGIAILVTGLAPEMIIVVGEVTRAWKRVGPIIEKIVKQRSVTWATTRIIAADPAEQTRLRGTVALVLQKHFGAPSIA
ncbi:MAG TPA: ROK family transcriptional regulator [Verrucomicrobiae bacterium]|nr:ROK family transcriptional regulator [Verrucomicrobiae bacterium]